MHNKYHLISGLIMIFTALLLGQTHSQQKKTTLFIPKKFDLTKKPFSFKKKPVFLFDLHGVLVKKSWKNYLTSAFTSIPHKVWLPFYALCAFCSPKIVAALIQLKRRNCEISEAYFNTFLQMGHETFYNQCMCYAVALYQENTKMSYLTKRLNENGCKVFIFSNIGPEMLKRSIEKDPRVFKYCTSKTNVINQKTPNHAHDWIWKPCPISFIQACNYVKTDPGECIFIDNSLENVQAAQSAGIPSILFKNAEQCIKDLRTLCAIN